MLYYVVDLGQKGQQYIDAGKLVPDDLVVSMILASIRKIPTSESWLLDGRL